MRIVIKTREYARFRSGLYYAAYWNIKRYQTWQRRWANELGEQFFASGEVDAHNWFARQFCRDVGLMVADGVHTRVGAEVPL